MSDRDALLNAIRANPDEDTPRLMFADWLDELESPLDKARAQLIRMQCESSAKLATINSLSEAALKDPENEEAQAAFQAALQPYMEHKLAELKLMVTNTELRKVLLREISNTQTPDTSTGIHALFAALDEVEWSLDDPTISSLFEIYSRVTPGTENEHHYAHWMLNTIIDRGFIQRANLSANHIDGDFLVTMANRCRELNSTQEPISELRVISDYGILGGLLLSRIRLQGLKTLDLNAAPGSDFTSIGGNPAFVSLENIRILADEIPYANAQALADSYLPKLKHLRFGESTFAGDAFDAFSVLSNVELERQFLPEREQARLIARNKKIRDEKRAEQTDFLYAIRQAPEKDEPRLAYAQWLETKGQKVEGGNALYVRESNAARAQFIRLQVEEASLEVNDPKRAEIKEQARPLVEKFGVDWARADLGRFAREYSLEVPRPRVLQVGRLGPDLETSLKGSSQSKPIIHFRRGFVDQVLVYADSTSLHARSVGKYMADLLRETTVTSLDFTSSTVGQKWLLDATQGAPPRTLNISGTLLDVRRIAEGRIATHGAMHPALHLTPDQPEMADVAAKLKHIGFREYFDFKRLTKELEQFPTLKPETVDFKLGTEADGYSARRVDEFKNLLASPNFSKTYVFVRNTEPNQAMSTTVPSALAALRDEHNAQLDERIQQNAARYLYDKGILPAAIPAPDGAIPSDDAVTAAKLLYPKAERGLGE